MNALITSQDLRENPILSQQTDADSLFLPVCPSPAL
jgi:hypothetical protein